MNNVVFNYSFYTGNLLPIMGPRKYCICGEEMDCLGQHSLVCQVSSIRSKIRNPAHAKLSRGLKAILAQTQKSIGYSLANEEPMITKMTILRRTWKQTKKIIKIVVVFKSMITSCKI
jgi:hypothetical protein